MSLKKLIIEISESDLRGCVGLVFHLCVNAEEFAINKPVFLELREEAVLILVNTAKAVAQA